MRSFFADLHVHIGATSKGNPVKITASRKLPFENIINECREVKGIDIVGIVDCAAPGVLADIQDLVKRGELLELPEGGMLHREKVTVILASEIETAENQGGPAHHIAYFPFLPQINTFSRVMSQHITNIELSSQRAALTSAQLLAIVKSAGGLLIPAHCFTPHKSIYGSAGESLWQIFQTDSREELPAIELGLSADTDIADYLAELSQTAFLSNSDSHSLAKIGREYNVMTLPRANFKEVVLALHRRGGRGITANYGMNPKLGKYHRSYCLSCNRVIQEPPPIAHCPYCKAQEGKFVTGVLDRVLELEHWPEPRHPGHRPPYRYQIPLEFVPAISNTIFRHLIATFGSEMAVLHRAGAEELKLAVGWRIAQDIIAAREGKLSLKSGGGGQYGKVIGVQSATEQMQLF